MTEHREVRLREIADQIAEHTRRLRAGTLGDRSEDLKALVELVEALGDEVDLSDPARAFAALERRFMEIDLEQAFSPGGDFAAHEWLIDYAWDTVGPELTADEDAWDLYQRGAIVQLAPRLRRALDVLRAAGEIEDPAVIEEEDREILGEAADEEAP